MKVVLLVWALFGAPAVVPMPDMNTCLAFAKVVHERSLNTDVPACYPVPEVK